MLVRTLTVGLLLGTTACYSIKPVLNARDFIPANRPARVWVVNNANETYVLSAPRVEGDNIVGTRVNSNIEVTIPLGQAQLVEARQRDKGKTLAVGVILGVVGAGTIYLVASAGNGNVDPGTYTGMDP